MRDRSGLMTHRQMEYFRNGGFQAHLIYHVMSKPCHDELPPLLTVAAHARELVEKPVSQNCPPKGNSYLLEE